jgi:hypothetical protein
VEAGKNGILFAVLVKVGGGWGQKVRTVAC